MNKKISTLILVSFVGLFAFTNQTSAQYAVPTCNSVTLNGHIETNGATTNVWFEWGAGNAITYGTPTQTFSEDSNYSQLLTGLNENSTYSYRAMASNDNGDSVGQTLTFTTASCNNPANPPSAIWTNYCTGQYDKNPWQIWAYDNSNPRNYKFIGTDPSCAPAIAQTPTAPTVSLTADSTSVPMNGATTLRWSSTNADSCNASGGSFNWFGAKNLSGLQSTGVLTNTTTYSMTCYNSAGSNSKSVTVNVQPQQQEAQRCNDQSATNYNQVGACTYAQRCTDTNATNYNQVGACTYAQRCTDTNATNYNQVGACTYAQRCTDSSATNYNSVGACTYAAQRCNDTSATNYNQVGACRYSNVQPTVDISADDTSINYNSSTIVRWTSTNATSCTASGGTNGWSGTRNRSDSFSTGNLTNTVTYNITCSNNNSSRTDSVTINVNGQNNNDNNGQQPTIKLTADNSNVGINGSTIVRWTSSNAQSCYASGGSNSWQGFRGVSGSFNTGVLNKNTIFYMACSNSYGTVVDSVTIYASGNTIAYYQPTTPVYTAASPLVLTSMLDVIGCSCQNVANGGNQGSEVLYTITYQNTSNTTAKNLSLQVTLPQDTTYISSAPYSPSISGNKLTYNLGNISPNSQGSVMIRVRARDNMANGANVTFYSILNHTNGGQSLSVNDTVSTQLYNNSLAYNAENTNGVTTVAAAATGVSTLTSGVVGWLLLIVLVLLIIILVKYLLTQNQRKTIITTIP